MFCSAVSDVFSETNNSSHWFMGVHGGGGGHDTVDHHLLSESGHSVATQEDTGHTQRKSSYTHRKIMF